ncbi:MAG: hypothetical protein IKQ83_01760 [Lachnospiraceae bacterium]|nr:hypothetical protein [Lachnospiraceae bacterium]
MINEDKVILMTKLASYEQREGKRFNAVAGYFRTDYISSQLMRSFIAGTLAFLAIIGVFLFYNFEVIMEDIYNTDLLSFGKKVAYIYLICMGVYLLFSYILAIYRYNKARGSIRSYYANLKKLEKY